MERVFRTHLDVGVTGGACGLATRNSSLTQTPKLVDCGRCQETIHYADALHTGRAKKVTNGKPAKNGKANGHANGHDRTYVVSVVADTDEDLATILEAINRPVTVTRA